MYQDADFLYIAGNFSSVHPHLQHINAELQLQQVSFDAFITIDQAYPPSNPQTA
jgi:hypothetical protein